MCCLIFNLIIINLDFYLFVNVIIVVIIVVVVVVIKIIIVAIVFTIEWYFLVGF